MEWNKQLIEMAKMKWSIFTHPHAQSIINVYITVRLIFQSEYFSLPYCIFVMCACVRVHVRLCLCVCVSVYDRKLCSVPLFFFFSRIDNTFFIVSIIWAKPDVILGCETWLKPGMGYGEIFPPGYYSCTGKTERMDMVEY